MGRLTKSHDICATSCRCSPSICRSCTPKHCSICERPALRFAPGLQWRHFAICYTSNQNWRFSNYFLTSDNLIIYSLWEPAFKMPQLHLRHFPEAFLLSIINKLWLEQFKNPFNFYILETCHNEVRRSIKWSNWIPCWTVFPWYMN